MRHRFRLNTTSRRPTFIDLSDNETETQQHVDVVDNDNDNDVKKKGILKSEAMKTILERKRMKFCYGSGPSNYCCNICLDVIPVPLVWARIKCNHTFCRYCILNCVQQAFQQSDFGYELCIMCPLTKCKEVMMPIDLVRIIPSEVYGRWVERRRELELYKYPVLDMLYYYSRHKNNSNMFRSNFFFNGGDHHDHYHISDDEKND